jgi:glycosyltransferase involved in cell wall biosynthesis
MAVQQTALGGVDHGAQVDWSWIVAHLPPPEGIELHLATLWPGGTTRKSFEFRGAQFHLLPCPKRGRALTLFFRDQSYFEPLFRELHPEVVHGWGTEDSFGLAARRLAPTRHVVGIQGLITAYRKRIKLPVRTLFTQLTEKMTLRRARWVVAESRYSIEIARPFCPRAFTRVIDHPLRDEFAKASPATGQVNKVLFVGTIDERKGVFAAVRSFAEASDDTWTLQVIGSGRARDEEAMFELVEECGLQNRFSRRRGLSASEIAECMRDSSVFLLPTRIDTGPTALKEALSMGLWPVCYDNSGPGEYLRSAEFGTLAQDGNYQDLAKKLGEVLQQRPWSDQIRRAAVRQFSEQRFSRDVIWGELIQLYKNIIAAAA